jgi:hypothetical protein
LPEAFSHSTILYFGEGITKTVYKWGDALLTEYGKTRANSTSDESIKVTLLVNKLKTEGFFFSVILKYILQNL